MAESLSSVAATPPIRTSGLVLTPADLRGFRGIRVIPDVYGAFDAFDRALRDAERDGRFVVQLGDLIDRGPYSTLCVERMLEVESQGRGRMFLGNHEVAFARFILSGASGAVTRQATLMEFKEYGGDLLERFISRILEGPLWIRASLYLFVRVAFHPRMLTALDGPPDPDLADVATQGAGSARERREGTRSRAWVDRIPGGLIVVVGHAVTPSGAVETVQGRLGRTAIFADTGPGATRATIYRSLIFRHRRGACVATELGGHRIAALRRLGTAVSQEAKEAKHR